MRLIGFDTETADAAGHICSVGITIAEEGKIKECYYYLVDPESDFDAMNIYIHGIRPEDVEGKANFSSLWKELRPVLESGLVVAHNAPFDMGVLSKALRRYDLDYSSGMNYLCTCGMSRKLLPELTNHRLDTLCDFYGIVFDHHNAGSDSFACTSLLLRFMESGADINSFIREYDMDKGKTISTKRKTTSRKNNRQS